MKEDRVCLSFLDSYIESLGSKAKFWRIISIAVIFINLAFMISILTLLIYLDKIELERILIFASFSALILGCTWHYGRSLWAFGTLYIVRLAHLQDLRLYLLLVEENKVPPDSVLQAILTLRRDFVGDVVKSTIPEGSIKDIFQSLIKRTSRS